MQNNLNITDLGDWENLRDRFAMAALTRMSDTYWDEHYTDDFLALQAYKVADAMMKAREAKND